LLCNVAKPIGDRVWVVCCLVCVAALRVVGVRSAAAARLIQVNVKSWNVVGNDARRARIVLNAAH
jgi:hypothetical protein